MTDQLGTSRLDVSRAVETLLNAAAPEQAEELTRLWGQHEDRVHLTDKPSFDIGAWFGVVQATELTLEQVWLLGFASWRAIQAYSGVIWLLDYCHAPFNRDQVSATHGQVEADRDFDTLLQMVRELRDPQRFQGREWPSGIPRPTTTNQFADPQHRAAYELACISGAFIFLHELQHVLFERDGNAPATVVEEEAACDLFARNFLMQSTERYASESQQDAAMVKSKRALGIMVAKMLMLEISPLEQWSSGSDHPAVGERVRAFLADVPTDVTGHFWLAASSLLAAMCRSRGRLPENIQFNGCRDLTIQLAGCL